MLNDRRTGSFQYSLRRNIMKKAKKLNLKLKLNKETINRLDKSDSGKVYGGKTSLSQCPTYCVRDCGDTEVYEVCW
jgi:hypothetical protein